MPSFTWPARGPITSPFGPRDISGNPGISPDHKGIDIGVPDKTSVVAAASGKIIAQGLLGIGGNTVIINHGGGYATLYAHLSKFTQRMGDQVAQGQQIGLSGGLLGELGSGNSRGAHLHFEIRLNGVSIDPMGLLNSPAMSPITPGNKASTDKAEADAKASAERNKNSDKWWWIGSGENLPGMKKTGEIVDSVAGPINIVAKVGGFIIDPSNWKRIGLGTLGVSLLLIATIELLASDGAVKTITKAVA